MNRVKDSIEIVHRFFEVAKAPFNEMVEQLLQQYTTLALPVRIVFFGEVEDNEVYVAQLACLAEGVQRHFGTGTLPVSYVAQPVDGQGLAMEVHEVECSEQDTVSYRRSDGLAYIVVEREGCKRVFLSGVMGDVLHQTISEQAESIFIKITRLMAAEGLPLRAIVRQWNYIEQITAYDAAGHQHYQDFNDARSIFYEGGTWPTGYPAATGIGTQCGGVMIDIDLLLSEDATVQVYPVDNSLQVPAHAYSQRMLLGETLLDQKTTPKFERAKAIRRGETSFIYVSGTAAIRGEQSLEGVGIREQTLITLENIEYLISVDNLCHAGMSATEDATLVSIRVYVKYRADMQQAREVVETRYPHLPVIYTLTDVCRAELLVEVEGTAVLR